MSPECPDRATLRSVAELNAAIRELWPHRDTRLTDEQRAEYHRLLAELEQAKRRGITTAA